LHSCVQPTRPKNANPLILSPIRSLRGPATLSSGYWQHFTCVIFVGGLVQPTLSQPSANPQPTLSQRGAVCRLGDAVSGHNRADHARLPRSSTGVFPRRVEAHVPEILRPALGPALDTIATHTSKIRELDRRINTLARASYPDTALLTQVAGIGNLTALAYILTLEDPSCFAKARMVESYLGLLPRQRDSGDEQPQLCITKSGDALLRYLLVERARHMMSSRGADTELKRWGLKLAERGGKNAKKRAVVAVARKLSVLLGLWVTGEAYEPLRNGRVRGELALVPS
jgi:hypothetical protein